MNEEDDMTNRSKRQKVDPVPVKQTAKAPVKEVAKTVEEDKPKAEKESTYNAALEAIRKMKEKKVVTETHKFAGQSYTTSRAKTQSDLK